MGGLSGPLVGGRWKATHPTVSAFSSIEVAVLPSGSLSAGVVDDANGFVYCTTLQHLSLSPRILSAPGFKVIHLPKMTTWN